MGLAYAPLPFISACVHDTLFIVFLTLYIFKTHCHQARQSI